MTRPLSDTKGHVFAPGCAWGKVMLFGEYAVLEGSPALLVSTPHQATARYFYLDDITTLASINEAQSLIDKAQGLHLNPYYLIDACHLGTSLLCVCPRTQQLKTLGQNFPLIREALKQWGAPSGIYRIDTSRFGTLIDGQWVKMGIGSSGAATAALVELFNNMCTEDDCTSRSLSSRRERFDFTCKVHTQVQGGLGSGADVATSIYGGLVKYEYQSPSTRQACTIKQRLPHTWGVWQGGSTSTVSALKQLKLWRVNHEQQYDRVMKQLRTAANHAMALLQSSTLTPQKWCHAVAFGAEATREMSLQTGIQVWTPRHEKWRKLLAPYGGEIKPTGAGGDDLTLLTASSPEAEKRCLEALKREADQDGVPLIAFPLGQ